jgi:hypothetical protein
MNYEYESTETQKTNEIIKTELADSESNSDHRHTTVDCLSQIILETVLPPNYNYYLNLLTLRANLLGALVVARKERDK